MSAKRRSGIFTLFAGKRLRGTVLPQNRCGNGREPTPDNLVPAERGRSGPPKGGADCAPASRGRPAASA